MKMMPLAMFPGETGLRELSDFDSMPDSKQPPFYAWSKAIIKAKKVFIGGRIFGDGGPHPQAVAPAAPPEQNTIRAQAALAGHPPVTLNAQKPLQVLPQSRTAKKAQAASTSDRATGSKPATKVTFHICTIAGSAYLIKVLTLYRSLEAVTSDFLFYVCCMDENTLLSLKKLRLCRCVAIPLFALMDSELSRMKAERKPNEFSWTLKSHFLYYLLKEKGLPEALYCDSDVAFFSSPQQLYDDWGDSSVYLCRQRDLDWVESKYGKYQAGVAGFRNDKQGLDALRWWRDKCRDWCFAYQDESGGRYGDQKYLDALPELFGSVKISTHRGINAAPWNTVYNNDYPISTVKNAVTIDGDPLVAYHFACLEAFDAHHFDLWNLSNITIGPVIRKAIYIPYLTMLRNSIASVKILVGSNLSFYLSPNKYADAKTPYIYSERNVKLLHWDGAYGFCTISSKKYVARTIALYSSLRKQAGSFHMWICCMDDTAYSVLSAFKLDDATLIHVSEVETPEVRQTKPSKKLHEYCWTLKPLLCQYVLSHYNITRLLYCDSDMYFYSHPKAIHEAWRGYETFMNLQLGTAALEHKHGMYQAGMIGFTKASESLKILDWWAKQCTAWCYDEHIDPERWGDQKYLTKVPNLFCSIKVNDQYGMLAAPWNIVMNNTHKLKTSCEDGEIKIGQEKLTCYHFGSIRIFSENEFDLWKHDQLEIDPSVMGCIYQPYLEHLRAIYQAIRAKGIDVTALFDKKGACQNFYALKGGVFSNDAK
jgi:hypothetical protein